MPAVLANIAAAAEAALDTVVVGTTTVADVLASTAVSVGLSAISSFLLKPSLSGQEQKQNIRQPTSARRRYYGQVGAAGVYL